MKYGGVHDQGSAIGSMNERLVWPLENGMTCQKGGERTCGGGKFCVLVEVLVTQVCTPPSKEPNLTLQICTISHK